MDHLITVCSLIIAALSFLFNRKDKIVEETKSSNLSTINYKLQDVQDDLNNINKKIDKIAGDIDDRINKAIFYHEEIYHNHRRRGGYNYERRRYKRY